MKDVIIGRDNFAVLGRWRHQTERGIVILDDSDKFFVIVNADTAIFFCIL